MTELAREQYVVANPGSIPWLAELASHLAEAGLLRRYVVSMSDQLPAARRLLRLSHAVPPLSAAVQRELRKRRVPRYVRADAIAHEAVAWEALHALAWQANGPSGFVGGLGFRRSAIFDRRASCHVQSGDAVVIATQTAALATLRRARAVGAHAVLDCPIAYYRYAERLLQAEVKAAPAFAGTMQFHRFSDRYRRRVDDELAASTRLVVYTELAAATFQEAGVDRRNVVVSPLGVDADLFHPTPRVEDGVFRVIFVGQISQRKGLSYLLDAFRLAGLRRAELLLVGRTVGDAARHIAGPDVVHHPHVPRWELPTLYGTADVFVLPTLIEGMPQTALEAMACGLPVIVSENAFGGDMLRDGRDAYVVPIRDSHAIAERLRELCLNPDRRAQLGLAARRRAEEFSWSAFAGRIREALR